jgi:hypothetical protein
MTDTFNFYYKKAYTSSVQFNTIVDEKFTGKEQRRDVWTNPRRKWMLEFEKNKVDRESLVNFFIAQKGRKKAFNWTWLATDPVTGEKLGGDGQTYLVRFDTDELQLDILELGYSTFSIPIVQVFE